MEFFEFALSGFWTFCGVSILLSIGGYYAVAFVAVLLTGIRGGNIKIGGSE